jgi:hypothetical protein
VSPRRGGPELIHVDDTQESLSESLYASHAGSSSDYGSFYSRRSLTRIFSPGCLNAALCGSALHCAASVNMRLSKADRALDEQGVSSATQVRRYAELEDVRRRTLPCEIRDCTLRRRVNAARASRRRTVAFVYTDYGTFLYFTGC